MSTEPEQLRRHLRAMAVVNRQLQAQLAEVGVAGASSAGARVGAAGGVGPVGVSSARWAWRQVAPLLPPATAESLRKRAKPRLVGRSVAPARSAPRLPVPAAGAAGAVSAVSVAGSVSEASPRHVVAAHWLNELAAAGTPRRAELVRRPDGVVFLVEDALARRVKSGMVAVALEEEFGLRRHIDEDEAARLVEGPPIEVMLAARGAPFVIVGGARRALRGIPVPYPVEDEDDIAPFPDGAAIDVARANVARQQADPAGRQVARLPGPVEAGARRGLRAARRLKAKVTG